MTKEVKLKRKFPSKFVAKVIDSVIDEKLKGVKKNSKTAKKWLTKMKFNLLKNISSASKIVFADTGVTFANNRFVAFSNWLF